MTTKPTIEANKAVGSVLTASEWNTNVLQAANYTFEVLGGNNTDKIPGTALVSTLVLPGTVVFGTNVAPNAAPSNVGLGVNTAGILWANTQSGGEYQWNINGAQIATLAGTGVLTLGSTLSTAGITSAASWPSGQTLQESGSKSVSGGATSGLVVTYSAGSSAPYGLWTVILNGNTRYIPYYA